MKKNMEFLAIQTQELNIPIIFRLIPHYLNS